MFVASLLATAARADDETPANETPWPASVSGFAAPAAGEHPRLLFRKANLPEIRKRAQTPEGQAIVKRLRVLLNGSDGESLPTVQNGSAKAYGGNTGKKDPAAAEGKDDKDAPAKGELPVGAYTMSHAAGYGMLYQITGKKKYADLGRQCFEKAAGVKTLRGVIFDLGYSYTSDAATCRPSRERHIAIWPSPMKKTCWSWGS